MLTTTVALAFASLALAQQSWNVQVGQNGALTYNPPSINAKAGDTVVFTFNPKNHTLTQTSFGTPCIPAQGGIDTGFVPVAAGASPQTRQITVPAGNSPLWFSCQQTGHCGKGMVFAINAPTTGNTFDKFQAAAIAQNGTSSSSVAPPATTVPPPVIKTVTATVTVGTSTWTTTYASWEGSAPPTPTANPIVHKVSVGQGGLLAFNPPNITASIGDTIQFEFNPKNHTVTESNFGNPCQSKEKSTGVVGFDSGFTPVAANATTLPTFSITVNSTAPIWVYCRQTGHCAAGMVFAANAVESSPNNFEAFQALARASNSSTSSTATATGSGAATSPTSGAISTSMNVGLTGVLAVIGFVALTL